jgi:hypothetical protein
MKSSLITFSLTALALAAPVPLQKRITASITLFDNKSFSGPSYTQSFSVDEPTCIAPTLPASIDSKASSVKLEGDLSHFNCRLYANQNCQVEGNGDNTWFFNCKFVFCLRWMGELV